MPAGLLGGSVYQTLIFNQAGTATDSIQLDLNFPGGLADLSLLGGSRITVLNGTSTVSSYALSNLLTLRLLGGQRFQVRVPAGGIYNAVKVELTGAVNLLLNLQVYGARILYPNPTPDTTSTSICSGSTATLKVTPAAGTTVNWYADSTTTTVLSTGATYTTQPLTATTTFYVASVGANNCINPVRVPVVVTVTNPATAADISVTNDSICAGSAAVLKPTSSTVTQPVFTWYKDRSKTTAITDGGTEANGAKYAIAADGTLTITGLPASTNPYTYYVSVKGANKCENEAGSLDSALVLSSAKPDTIRAGDVYAQTGVPVTLTAQPVTGAGTVYWYTSPTGTDTAGTGNPLQVGPFNTPGTYNYYPALHLPGGCESDRILVRAIITGPFIPDTACNRANSQTSATVAICALCSVTNPNADIDADTTNYTTLHMPAGVLGGSVYQILHFANTGNANDTVVLDIDFPGGLADASLAGGARITLLNGNTVVSTNTISNLLTVRLLSGQRYKLKIPASAAYDAVKVELTGILNLLLNLNIHSASMISPNPAVATNNASTCVGGKVTLNATAAQGTSLRWYATATGGTVLGTGNSFETPALTTPGIVTYYIEVVNAAGCANPDRIPVQVTVTPAPAAPAVQASNVAVCAGSNAVLSVLNPVSGYTYAWYNTPTGGTRLNSDSGRVYTVSNVSGPATYYVEAINDTCGAVSATRTAVTVNVASALDAPTVTQVPNPVGIGQQAQLTATSTTANANFVWLGGINGTDTLQKGGSTYIIQNAQQGASYKVYAELDGSTVCRSTTVTVAVNAVVVPPGPGPCEGASSQSIGGSGLLVLGNVYNPQLAIDQDTTTGSSLVINLGALNATVWQRVGFKGLSTPGDTLRLYLASPSQVLTASLLGGLQVTTFNGNTAQDSVLVNNALIKLTLLNNSHLAKLELVPAKQFDSVQLTLKSGLLSALTDINFNYAQRVIAKPTVKDTALSVCSGATATLEVTNPVAGITYRWYTSNGTYLAGKDGTTYTTDALNASTVYYVEAYRADIGCASAARARVAANVKALPAAPAVKSNNVQVCAGSEAALAVVPVSGVSYGWYTTATGGTKLNTDSGFVYKVVVTGTATYYVEAINDSCGTVSATRTPVTVNVASALAAPTVTPSPATVRTGEQALLTANAGIANVKYYWFGSQSGTDTLQKTGAATFATPAQTVPGAKTYWVSAVLEGSSTCQSDRTPVTVNTISSNPGDNGPCEGAISQTNGGSGLLVLGNVYNPALAVDKDTTTGSSLVIDLGALGANVWQRVGFSGLSTVGDTVRLTVESPSQVLSASLLGGLQISTFNGSSQQDVLQVNNPLVKVTLLSNSRQAKIEFVPTLPFDSVQLTMNSGLLTALGSINLNYVQRAIVKPQVEASSVSACAGTPALLKVKSPATGITYNWYDAQGNLVHEDSVAYYTPANLAVGSYNFMVKAIRGGCASAGTIVNVTVTGTADSTDIQVNGAAVCPGTTATLTASSSTVTNPQFKWYADAALTQLVSSSNTFTTGALTTNVTYYVTVSGDNKCANTAAAAKAVTVTVNSVADSADIQANNATVCVGSTATLTASSTTVTNPQFKWYGDAALTQLLSNASTFTTGALTADATYYVTVSGDNKCANSAATAKAVKVFVRPPADSTDIQANNAGICVGSTATLTASSSTVINPQFKWYADAALTQLLSNTNTYTTGTLTADATYYITVSGDNKCANSAAAAKVVKVAVNTAADSTDIQANGTTICAGSTATLTASSTTVINPQFKWYADATLTQLLSSANTYTTSALTTDSTYYITVSGDNKCANSAAAAKVVTVAVRAAADSTDIQASGATICAGSTATLTASSTTVTNAQFKWYADAALTQLLSSANAYTTGTLTANTTYYVTVSGDNKCANSAAAAKAVTVTVNTAADSTDIQANNATVCTGSSATLTASSTTVTNPQFKWYADAALTQLLSSSGTYTTSALTSDSTYYVVVSGDNRCGTSASAAKVVKVFVRPPADSTDIQANNASVCAGSAATLTASSSTVINPQFKWYGDAALTQLLSSSSSYTTAALTANATYYITVSGDNKCANSAATAKVVKVTVNTAADSADVQASDVTVCSGSTATLTASSTTVTNPQFKWYSDAALTQVLSTTNTYTTGPLTADATYYVTVSGDNKCATGTSAAKAVQVRVRTSSDSTDISVTGAKTICANTSVTLTASSSTVNNPRFTWYSDAALTQVVSTQSFLTVDTLKNSATYYVTVSGDNKCSSNTPGTAKAVVVFVNPVPDAPVVSTDGTTACKNQSTTLTVKDALTSTVYTWYDAASGGNLLQTGSTFVTPAITANTSYYVQADNGSCISGTRTRVDVTAVDKPSAPTIASTGTTACQGTNTTLSVNNPQANLVYNWYDAATGGTLLATGNTYTTNPLNANTTFYVESAYATGCSSADRTSVTVTVNAAPAAPSVVAGNVDVCAGSNATLQVNNPQSGYTYNWYSVATGGTVLFSGPNYTVNNITVSTVYYVAALNANGCSSTTRASVNVNVLPAPDAPTVANNTPVICAGSPVTLTASSTTPGATFNWYTSANSSTVVASGSSFTTGPITADTAFYVAAVNSNGCSSATRTQSVITILRPLPAPTVTVTATTATSVTFGWAAVTGATGYEVTTDGGTTYTAPSSGANGLSHTISGLQPNQTVAIQVRALSSNSCQTGILSTKVSGTSANPLGNDIYVPNVFTPNGDGKNDFFKPYGNMIANAEMWIFSQWGNALFHTNDGVRGWDGTAGGKPQPVGVYIYIIKITLQDGTVVTKKGSVNLIR
jgi:gliding motility-associated-like protein